MNTAGLRVILHPLLNANGVWVGRYSASLDGEVIVRSSRDPEHDAARALFALGKVGPFETAGEDGAVRMRFRSVVATMPHSISEEDRRGLRHVQHRPYTGEVAPQTAVGGTSGTNPPGESPQAADGTFP